MAFFKFRCDGPYATGAVKTTLDPKGLAFKLTRHKMPARMRPFDLTTSDMRTVTKYDYRWNTPGLAPRAAVMPDITTYDEQL